jgi:hypothetical protein
MPASQTTRYAKITVLVLILAAIAAVCFRNSLGGIEATMTTDGRTAQAEDDLRKEIDSESQGNIALANFRKTDGQANEVFGVKGYNLQFEGDICFRADGVWIARSFGSPTITFSFSKTPVAFGQMNGATKVNTGQRVKIAGTLEGRQSESGWNFGFGECHVVSQ